MEAASVSIVRTAASLIVACFSKGPKLEHIREGSRLRIEVSRSAPQAKG
jgi:hypothetical protein